MDILERLQKLPRLKGKNVTVSNKGNFDYGGTGKNGNFFLIHSAVSFYITRL